MAQVEVGPTGGITVKRKTHDEWHEASLSARQVLVALSGTTGMTAVLEFVMHVFSNGNSA